MVDGRRRAEGRGMITALLLIASFVCLLLSHSCATRGYPTRDPMLGFLMLILWALGMLMAYAAGLVL